jgi:hypothetical protein
MGFRTSVGWNEASSSITIDIVENAGDRFVKPQAGTPMVFQSGELRFEGIVQRVLEKRSAAGAPVYEVNMTDPREFLEGAKVVIDSYTGAVNGVPNIINAYGYFENLLGFGGSLNNQSGMLWLAPFSLLGLASDGGGITINPVATVGIMPAIQALTAAGGSFGGPLQYKGHSYRVDLSGLPVPPAFYRIGGNSAVSILECVSQLCHDAGCDYICYLENGTIKFKVAFRKVQPSLGTLANFVNTLPNVISKDVGTEFCNDPTNAVLLGGNVQYLVSQENPAGTDAIWPFWGLDQAGQPIIGQGKPEEDHRVKLNAEPIADIMGSFEYELGIPELRCAAVGDFDSWAAYVLRWEPDKAQTINLVSAVDWESDMEALFPDLAFARDMVADGPEAVLAFGEMNKVEENYWMERAQRVYDFVRDYADNYFGRKFLVRIPFFIYWKYENETSHLVATDEPCESGYIPEGSQTLGLQFQNENYFLDQDGKFQMYVRFNDTSNIDLQNLGAGEAVVQNNGLFVRAAQDTTYGVLYGANSIYPYIVVDIPAVYGKVTDPLGGIDDLATIMGLTPDAVVSMFEERQGSFPMRIAQPPYRPDAVALPIKSNRMSYGPWGTFSPWGPTGVAGKVTWDRNEDLVPWNYGDYNTLNQAAVAQLANAATNMQEVETASVELAEMPRTGLGDLLVAGGPAVTDIAVAMGAQGYTTSYTMQTFTPRRLGFDKSIADRLKRFGRQAQQMRLAVRQLFQRRQELGRAQFAARVGYLQNASRAIMQQSPHEVLTGSMAHSDSLSGYRTRCSLGDPREAMANVRADDPDIYWRSAAMSLEGLLRPFSTALTGTNAGVMPHFETPASVITSTMQSSTTLNPFKAGCDIDLLASGLQGDYPGTLHRLKTTQGDIDYANARPLGMRMPMVGVGWGYEVTGKPVPNASETGAINTWSSNFMTDYLKRPDKWKAGPMLLAWDNWRKGWTVPTILVGTLDTALSSGGSALMSIKSGGTATGDKVAVNEYLGTTTAIPVNSKVVAAWSPLENRWIVIAAACS